MSYVALRVDTIKQMGALPDDAVRLMLGFLAHIDHIGVCYPGHAKLAAVSGLTPRAVNAALGVLISMGWVGILEKRHKDRLNRWQPQVYQVCPYLLWISQNQIEAAIGLWSEREPESLLYSELHYNQQQNQQQNQKQEPSSITNTNNQQQQPAHSFEMGENPETLPIPRPTVLGHKKTNQTVDTQPAPMAQKTAPMAQHKHTPPVAPPPPQCGRARATPALSGSQANS
jgi:hypothetical protein